MNQRHRARVIGRKFFHSKYISWSYRNRGYDARIHRKRNVSVSVLIMNDVVLR